MRTRSLFSVRVGDIKTKFLRCRHPLLDQWFIPQFTDCKWAPRSVILS